VRYCIRANHTECRASARGLHKSRWHCEVVNNKGLTIYRDVGVLDLRGPVKWQVAECEQCIVNQIHCCFTLNDVCLAELQLLAATCMSARNIIIMLHIHRYTGNIGQPTSRHLPKQIATLPCPSPTQQAFQSMCHATDSWLSM
jgi:hypothetical protein